MTIHSAAGYARVEDWDTIRGMVQGLGWDVGPGRLAAEGTHRYFHAWIDDRVLGIFQTQVAPALAAFPGATVSINEDVEASGVVGGAHAAAVLSNGGISAAE